MGGGLYNNLDYSFAAGQEDGTFEYPRSQPGGGGRALRRQLKGLRDFIYGFDFLRMSPNGSIIKGGVPPGATARALVAPGQAVAIYVLKRSPADGVSAAATELQIELSSGVWQAEWVDTKVGNTIRSTRVEGGGIRRVDAPTYDTDIALRLKRQ
jgi:hypothetical protein